MFPYNVAAGTTVAFDITHLRNPPSTEPYGRYYFKIYYGGKLSITGGSNYLTVNTPGVLALTIAGLTANTSISAVNTNVNISIRTMNGFPSSGYVQITFPADILIY